MATTREFTVRLVFGKISLNPRIIRNAGHNDQIRDQSI